MSVTRLKVYLCGPINGCSDEEARGWRQRAKELLPECDFLDPMDRDYRGKEDQNVPEIVEGDKRDIQSCDVLLRRGRPVSEGSAEETLFAWNEGKRVVAFAPPPVSPWLRYHANCGVYPTLEEACAHIRQIAREEPMRRAIEEVRALSEYDRERGR